MYALCTQANKQLNQPNDRATDRSTITFYCEHLCKLTVCFGSLPAPEPKIGRSMCVLDDGNLIGIFKYRLSLLLVVGCTYCLISYGLRFLVCNEEIRMPWTKSLSEYSNKMHIMIIIHNTIHTYVCMCYAWILYLNADTNENEITWANNAITT